jgi:hypothetical protein
MNGEPLALGRYGARGLIKHSVRRPAQNEIANSCGGPLSNAVEPAALETARSAEAQIVATELLDQLLVAVHPCRASREFRPGDAASASWCPQKQWSPPMLLRRCAMQTSASE